MKSTKKLVEEWLFTLEVTMLQARFTAPGYGSGLWLLIPAFYQCRLEQKAVITFLPSNYESWIAALPHPGYCAHFDEPIRRG